MNPLQYQEEMRKLLISVKAALDKIIDDYGLHRRDTEPPSPPPPDPAS